MQISSLKFVCLFFLANLQSHPFIEKLGPKTFDHVKYFVVRNTATLFNHEIEHEQVQWAAPHLNYTFATTDIYIYRYRISIKIDWNFLTKLHPLILEKVQETFYTSWTPWHCLMFSVIKSSLLKKI